MVAADVTGTGLQCDAILKPRANDHLSQIVYARGDRGDGARLQSEGQWERCLAPFHTVAIRGDCCCRVAIDKAHDRS